MTEKERPCARLLDTVELVGGLVQSERERKDQVTRIFQKLDILPGQIKEAIKEALSPLQEWKTGVDVDVVTLKIQLDELKDKLRTVWTRVAVLWIIASFMGVVLAHYCPKIIGKLIGNL